MSVGDPIGAHPVGTPTDQNFLIPCSFLEKLAKSYIGPPGGLAQLIWGTLDPPLIFVPECKIDIENNKNLNFVDSRNWQIQGEGVLGGGEGISAKSHSNLFHFL